MKRNVSRLLSILLILCMVLALLPGTVWAATSGKCGENLSWSIRDNTLTISGTGKMYYFWNGHEEPWYDQRNTFATVVIGDGATSIGALAVYNCNRVTSVTIPKSVTFIGEAAFYDTSLKDVYYGGSESDWKQIEIESSNAQLLNATFHYNSIAPSIPATGTAYPSTQTVDIDGTQVTFQMYALRDANGGETNYIKVRDLALAMSTTKAPFDVLWDGVINLVPGSVYKATGTENSTPFSGKRTYKAATDPTNVDGKASDLSAFILTDNNGGDYTYYQLRDLARNLGFNVSWSQERGVFIESDKPYSESD